MIKKGKLMNSIYYRVVMLIICCCSSLESKNYELLIEPAWKRLDINDKLAARMGGALIHAGTIVLKKKVRSIAYLDDITLEWHGSKLTRLSASLYKNQPGKRFLAIEQNCVCDSVWFCDEQKLVLRLLPPQLVESFNNYYLVLTVSQEIEPLIKRGFFTVVPRSGGHVLPESLTKNPVRLAFAH